MRTNPFSYLVVLLLVVASTVFFHSCKEEKKDEDISESVQTTTSVIDKNIQVQVKEGIVTMKGEVADEATKNAAINAVKHIEGVKSVESRLTVKPIAAKAPQMSEGDIRLKQSIDSALALQNIKGVDITVSNGEVTLSGKVTRSQEVAIMKIAGEAHPSRLMNYLTVTDKEN